MMTAKHRALAIARFLAAAGCASGGRHGGSPSQQWRGTFYSSGGHATLDTDRVFLVFEGVPMPPSRSIVTSSLSVSGGGTSRVSNQIGQVRMTSYYSNDVNTITVGGFEVRLVNGGSRLLVGQQSFDLSGPKQTVVIHADATATVG